MIAPKLILEGLGLGFLLYLICAIGIRNGAVGMVHLYDPKVQDRVVKLGLTTAEEIRKRSLIFKSPFFRSLDDECEQIEAHVSENHQGRIHGMVGLSLGGTIAVSLLSRGRMLDRYMRS